MKKGLERTLTQTSIHASRKKVRNLITDLHRQVVQYESARKKVLIRQMSGWLNL